MSVLEATIDAIRRGIRAGRYAPGQRLIETDLARQLHVGRNTVREALRQLMGDGVVVAGEGRWLSVRSLNRQDVLGLMDVREVIEGLACRLAAENIDDGTNRKELESICNEMHAARADDDPMAYMANNERLHVFIVTCSRNPWVAKFGEQLWLSLFRVQFNRFVHRQARDLSMEQHEQIIAAILAGKGREAERLMRSHIRGARKFIEEFPSDWLGD